MKITANIFPAKIYSRVNVLSKLLHKILVLHRLRYAHRSILENMYFYFTYSIKTKIISMLGTGYFLKIAKINSQQEKPIFPNRKN